MDPTIQVKLLRVLQERVFQRLGDAEDRSFMDKVIAATNRDWGRARESGSFWEDFYYRLCSDQITTPTLAEQRQDNPGDLRYLLRNIATRMVGEREGEPLVEEVTQWIAGHLERDYPWPGNVRELEQCVRNITIHGAYRPRSRNGPERGEARSGP